MTPRQKSTVSAAVVALLLILAAFASPSAAQMTEPDIDISKTVDNPNPWYGDTVIYTICIENCGDWHLENVVVTDPDLGVGPLPGFPPLLLAGESWCEDFPYVVRDHDPCPLVNCAQVTSNPLDLPDVIEDEACAEIFPEPFGSEGCTLGFWKENAEKWGASAWCDAYEPGDSFAYVFGVGITISTEVKGGKKGTITNPTLLQALDANGGGINALARQAVAALLNACSDCVEYPIDDPQVIIEAVHDAVAAGPEAIQELQEELAYYNEADCPIDQHGECVSVED